MFKDEDEDALIEISSHHVKSGRLHFVVQFPRESKSRRLKIEEITANYSREFGEWKYYSELVRNEPEPVESNSRPLNPMVEHLVKGYLAHGDFTSALDTLKSAQYSNCIPSIDLVGLLLKECYLRDSNVSVDSNGIVLGYLLEGIRSRQWDEIVTEFLAGGNPLEEDEGTNFWEILRSLLERDEIDEKHRHGVLYFILECFKVKFEQKTLGNLVMNGIKDRRLRRQFISTHLFGLLQVTPSASECILEIISLVMASRIPKRRYDELLNDFYELAVTLDTTTELLIFLTGLSPFLRIELSLLILERLYYLGFYHPSPLHRLFKILDNLSKIKVEKKTTKSTVDGIIFRLVRMVSIWMVAFYQIDYRGKGWSLIRKEEAKELVERNHKLAHSKKWPTNIRIILEITLQLVEKLMEGF